MDAIAPFGQRGSGDDVGDEENGGEELGELHCDGTGGESEVT